jgi:hypothetical protein
MFTVAGSIVTILDAVYRFVQNHELWAWLVS